MEAAQAAGTTPFDLVGFSLGAGVAAVVAALYSNLVRSIVLGAGFTDTADSYFELEFPLWLDLKNGNCQALARLFLITGCSAGFLGDLAESQISASASVNCQRYELKWHARQIELKRMLGNREQVRGIARPTLVIGCTHDYIVPAHHQRPSGSLETGELVPFCPGANKLGAPPSLKVVFNPRRHQARVQFYMRGNRQDIGDIPMRIDC